MKEIRRIKGEECLPFFIAANRCNSMRTGARLESLIKRNRLLLNFGTPKQFITKQSLVLIKFCPLFENSKISCFETIISATLTIPGKYNFGYNFPEASVQTNFGHDVRKKVGRWAPTLCRENEGKWKRWIPPGISAQKNNAFFPIMLDNFEEWRLQFFRVDCGAIIEDLDHRIQFLLKSI